MKTFIDTGTKLYGVIGSPVKHSKSPMIFNKLFQKLGHNAVYLAFDDADVAKLFSGIKALGLEGVSVTIPHKSAALAYIDELDESAKVLQAINTVQQKNGKLYGYNFDGLACIQALLQKLPELKKEAKFLILGSGGSAHGIALTLASYKKLEKKFAFCGSIDIAVRNVAKAKNLSASLRALGINSHVFSFAALNDIPLFYDVVMNTTPVGMLHLGRDLSTEAKRSDDKPLQNGLEQSPSPSSSPFPLKLLVKLQEQKKDALVYDIIYTPLQTKLLKEAGAVGLNTLGGLDMFLIQAAKQFYLWTGERMTLEAMRRLWQEFPSEQLVS